MIDQFLQAHPVIDLAIGLLVIAILFGGVPLAIGLACAQRKPPFLETRPGAPRPWPWDLVTVNSMWGKVRIRKDTPGLKQIQEDHRYCQGVKPARIEDLAAINAVFFQ